MPVVKNNNGSIWTCGNYKQTINSVAPFDNYLIPQMEDLFVTLGGDQKFSKLDLSHA